MRTNVAVKVGTCIAAALAFAGCGSGPRDGDSVAARAGALKTTHIICHVPPGNPAGAHEISVASAAVPAHLAHGDRLGPCMTPGPCAGQADGTPCNDSDLCTSNDVCLGGTCAPGAPVTCDDRGACQTAGTCDSATGTCSYTPLADGMPCEDASSCTQDSCQAGVCVGRGPGDLAPGETKTFSCPLDAAAVDGLIQPTTCEFPMGLAYNNLFTGPVSLISHLDRWFADFDVFSLPDGRLQLLCVYRNGDGLQIGGTSGFTTATTCTPTSTSFVCTK
jgi:hypothetical protein